MEITGTTESDSNNHLSAEEVEGTLPTKNTEGFLDLRCAKMPAASFCLCMTRAVSPPICFGRSTISFDRRARFRKRQAFRMYNGMRCLISVSTSFCSSTSCCRRTMVAVLLEMSLRCLARSAASVCSSAASSFRILSFVASSETFCFSTCVRKCQRKGHRQSTETKTLCIPGRTCCCTAWWWLRCRPRSDEPSSPPPCAACSALHPPPTLTVGIKTDRTQHHQHIGQSVSHESINHQQPLAQPIKDGKGEEREEEE